MKRSEFDIKKFLAENKTSLNEEPIAAAPEEIYKLYKELYDVGHRIAAIRKRARPLDAKHEKMWQTILDHITKAQDIFTVLHADARKVKN